MDDSSLEDDTADSDDDDNLGAYSLDGNYGRMAGEFALASPPEEPTKTPSRQWAGQRRPPQASRTRNHRRPAREAAIDSTQPGRRRPDPSGVYRDQVYHFDGSTSSVIVPASVYNFSSSANLFGPKHTLSFWMRHAPYKFQQTLGRQSVQVNEEDQDDDDDLDRLSKHVREYLLCGVDSSMSNDETSAQQFPRPAPTNTHLPGQQHRGRHRRHQHRRHRRRRYALYLKNCHLILLMRSNNEASHDDEPVEWRWSLDSNQFCDNKWHLYTINVDYPRVELYVDGQQFEDYKRLGEVHDSSHRNSNEGDDEEEEEQHVDEDNDEPRSSTHYQSQKQTLGRLTLSVGACQANDVHHVGGQPMFGHFRGAMSGLSVVGHSNDEPSVIECLGQCSESLVSQQAPTQSDQHERSELTSGGGPVDNSLVAYQESQSRILLNGHDFLDVEDALAQVAYVNRRQLPSIGRRVVNMRTSIECFGSSSSSSSNNDDDRTSSTTQVRATSTQIHIDPVKVQVNVLPSSSLPVISIVGTPNLAREYEPFHSGIRLFESTSLRVKWLNLRSPGGQTRLTELKSSEQTNEDGNTNSSTIHTDPDYIEDSTTTSTSDTFLVSASSRKSPKLNPTNNLQLLKRRIEACHVHIYPPLNQMHETLILPVDQMAKLNLYWHQSQDGAILYGLDSSDHYEQLLKMILYRNQKPAMYSERTFRLTCSDMNGRLISNEYLQTITIIHLKPAQVNEQQVQHGHLAKSMDNLRQGPMNLVEGDVMMNFQDSRSDAREVHKSGHHHHRHSTGSYDHSVLEGSFEQSNKLNRIALAFLVFVVSLIVIMLVIALTNLKESVTESTGRKQSGDHEEAHRPRYVTKSGKLVSSKSMELQAMSFDRHSTRGVDCYFENLDDDLLEEELEDDDQEGQEQERRHRLEMVSYEEEELENGDNEDTMEEDFEDEEEEEEEEDEEDYDDDDDELLFGSDDMMPANRDNGHVDSIIKWTGDTRLFSDRSRRQLMRRRRRRRRQTERLAGAPTASSATSDLDSLSWDDEIAAAQMRQANRTNIVINPLDSSSAAARAAKHQVRTLVIEQRPDGRDGFMRAPAETRLSHHPAVLAGGPAPISFPSDSDDNQRHRTIIMHEDEETDEPDLIPLDEDMASVCSSHSSSSCTDTTFDNHHHHHHHHECHLHHKNHHLHDEEEAYERESYVSQNTTDDEEDLDDSQEADELASRPAYELLHRHHIHHDCLKRLKSSTTQTSPFQHEEMLDGGPKSDQPQVRRRPQTSGSDGSATSSLGATLTAQEEGDDDDDDDGSGGRHPVM